MTFREIYNQIKSEHDKVLASKNGIYVSLFVFFFAFFLSFFLENPIFKLPMIALSFYGWLTTLKLFENNKNNKR
jgi:hypothetical protein